MLEARKLLDVVLYMTASFFNEAVEPWGISYRKRSFTHQHEEEEEGDMMEKIFCLPNLAQTHFLVGS